MGKRMAAKAASKVKVTRPTRTSTRTRRAAASSTSSPAAGESGYFLRDRKRRTRGTGAP